MKSKNAWLSRIFLIFVFAVAFALVEAVVVVYLRQIFGMKTISNYPQTNKDQIVFTLGAVSFLKKDAFSMIFPKRTMLIEQAREAATIIMLASFGWLAGKNWKEKVSVFFFSFGVWDIFYYVFLYVLIGWPKSLFATDIYFLIPVPWVGPVITPVVTSLILTVLSLLFFYRNATGKRLRRRR